jgi:hypothetical protein
VVKTPGLVTRTVVPAAPVLAIVRSAKERSVGDPSGMAHAAIALPFRQDDQYAIGLPEGEPVLLQRGRQRRLGQDQKVAGACRTGIAAPVIDHRNADPPNHLDQARIADGRT